LRPISTCIFLHGARTESAALPTDHADTRG
jgi:hypothetical protein